ncbi:GumC family protein [Sphingopyxis kveilinensis]|uniref:GumC family protein n=1 Tax=Sphingopyxis kveilinensis TaxID=3114367 RepID=UPI0030D4AB70
MNNKAPSPAGKAFDSYHAQDILDDDQQGAEDARLIDLREIWAIVYRSRFWIATIMASAIVLGIIVTLLMTPRYRADAAVQIDQEAIKVLGTEQSESSASIQDAERFLKTQVDVINSRAVARAVANELRLFNGDRFLEQMRDSQEVEATSSVSLADAKRERVLTVLQKNLTVELPPQSRVVRIFFTSPDPALAARVANSYAENFIRLNLRRKFDSSSYAREFLREQLDEAQQRLARAERSAVQYAREKKIIDASAAASTSDRPSAPRSLTTGTLVQLNQQQAEATAKRIQAEQRWNRARAVNSLSIPEVLENTAVQALLAEKAQLNAQLMEETQRRRDDYPTVRQGRARIIELDQQIGAIASSIRSTIRTEYEVARTNEQALGNRVEQLKSSTFSEQSESIQLSILRREADTFRQQYEFLLARFNQLNAEAGVQANNISLIDQAVTPIKPSSPKIVLNLFLAAILGGIISTIFCYVRHTVFDTIRTPDDVARNLNLPLLGVVPKPENPENLANELRDPKQPISEAFSSLRSTLSMISTHGLPKTLAFTSTTAAEGKSTACFATALSLARTGKRLLVIDLDLRRPNQHNQYGIKNTEGMSELLSGNRTFADVVRKTNVERVDMITGGAIPPNPTELLDPGSIRAMLAAHSADYDVILVDSAPVLAIADAISVGNSVEAVIYVIESNKNLPKTILAALSRLRDAHANVSGVLLTKFDASSSGYGNSYESTYQYEYGH